MPVATNCIVWDNVRQTADGVLSNCITDVDPLFVRAGTFDFARRATYTIGAVTLDTLDVIVSAPDLQLRAQSPAIDAGVCGGAPDHDIAGNVRPLGAGCDIGAYEFSAEPTHFTRADANGDGDINIADLIFILQYLFAGGQKPDCIDAADVNDSGAIDISDAVYGLAYLFAQKSAPPPPFTDCGVDPTTDVLTCDGFEPCR
jgi:hypothetical protein